MKKTLLILAAIVLFFAGCKKDDVIEASKLEMTNEMIERGWDYIMIRGVYDYPDVLAAMTLYLSEKADMSGAKTYKCTIEGKTFSVKADGLKNGVTYHYQYEYDNGYTKEKGEKGSATTVDKPIVVTKQAEDITTVSALISGTVTNNDTFNKIEERGLCWGTKTNPTIAGSHHNCGGSTGTGTTTFSHKLTNLQNNTKYYFRAYIKTNLGVIYGGEKSFKTKSLINGHDWVDLGLPSGLKWATCNVGASSPEDYGNYYAWGETTTKSTYTSDNSLTYTLTISELQSQGYIDENGNLTPMHDAAAANWGGSWRMPTIEELEEIVDNCTWIWTQESGVDGHKVIGPNGNYVFLPVAGYRSYSSLSQADLGLYWSSTLNNNAAINACNLIFGSGAPRLLSCPCSFGLSVRPVSE